MIEEKVVEGQEYAQEIFDLENYKVQGKAWFTDSLGQSVHIDTKKYDSREDVEAMIVFLILRHLGNLEKRRGKK